MLKNHPVAKIINEYINIFKNENGNDTVPIGWKIIKSIDNFKNDNPYYYVLLCYYSNCKYISNYNGKCKAYNGCWYIISENYD